MPARVTRCKGTKSNGERCTRKGPGLKYCAQHADQATEFPPKSNGKQKGASKRPSGPRRQPEDWRPKFLQAFEQHATVMAACRAVPVARSTVYKERADNKEFAEAFTDIEQVIVEQLEAEARRRAVDGWIERAEYEYDQDGEQRIVSQVRKFSDTLLIVLLKARDPEHYRERHTVEHTGAGGGPLTHRLAVDLTKLTPEQLDALEALHGNAGRTQPS